MAAIPTHQAAAKPIPAYFFFGLGSPLFACLLEIAEDGIIDATERPEFDAILAEVWELVRVGLELSLTEEDRQVAG